MTPIPDDIMREARLKLIREAIRFSNWAAGGGISPAEGEPASSPENFLFDYSSLTDDVDWDAYSGHIPDDLLASERTRTQKETAERCAEIAQEDARQREGSWQADAGNRIANAIRAAFLEGKEK